MSEITIDPQQHVRVGRVAKPHGIRGELKILPYGTPEDFRGYRQVLLAPDSGGVGRLLTVTSFRPQGKMVLLQLAGIDDREGAEAVSGLEVWLEKEDLAALGDDEFYWHELVGLRAVSESGRELGKVSALFSTGGHDILVIRGGGREYLVPARREFMLEVDQAAGRLTLADVPGLFDVNE